MSEALKRDYEVCEEIGRGRFGTVYRCVPSAAKDGLSGESFAVKSIDKRSISGDSLDEQCLLAEPKILSLISPHPHIVGLRGVYEDGESLHVVMDLCDAADLHGLVAARRALPEPEAAALMAQLMQAVAHCHRLGVAHRDVKPDNVLFDRRGRLRLADFGSAEIFRAEPMSGVVGTPYYVAPEVLARGEYGEKVDVWSAGAVMYVMLAGFPPFYGETVAEIFAAVMRGNLRFPARIFHSISPAAKDLLRRMLCKDVSRRFSAEQVLRHPWITKLGVQNE